MAILSPAATTADSTRTESSGSSRRRWARRGSWKSLSRSMARTIQAARIGVPMDSRGKSDELRKPERAGGEKVDELERALEVIVERLEAWRDRERAAQVRAGGR